MLLISHYGNAALPMGLKELCSLSLLFSTFRWPPRANVHAWTICLCKSSHPLYFCLFEHVLNICFHWSLTAFPHDFDFDTLRLQFNLRLIQQLLCNIHLDCFYCTIRLLCNIFLSFAKKSHWSKLSALLFAFDRLNKILTTQRHCSACYTQIAWLITVRANMWNAVDKCSLNSPSPFSSSFHYHQGALVSPN